ncbi:budding uninhibited by benzimidazoles 3-like protein, isoform CRA_b [Gonapodya prolifera JEL478]|uniref:Budding uninhibited by benzimidazoles 3-like protein, isoform CRA_b n=1 Tax=Gonapodya prolifera (strain JEL478) TaxID=1344416 RepID=A0A139AV32_GONPJ|nr:budding uninhibited by benzimidazoles 3-like protein, isoform CRA_b [Gonapodya prolifera JEL478]|eukprot:KXS20559.1 budding uninhibited by benzimidazoles 3-like protein, isoform CRA_b [Gonapodya prolifera JEL478]
MAQEFELADSPSDGISSVIFSPSDPALLLSASWDKHVRLHDVQSNSLRHKYSHKAAVFDVCFAEPHVAVSGGLDKRVKMVDLNTGQESILGKHDDAVRNVVYDPESKTMISGSWDKTIRQWDFRQPPSRPAGVQKQSDKVLSLDITPNGHKLVVAMANRHVFVYDTRNMDETFQKRESSLKFMTRAVKCMPNGEGYASSSIEGRIAVEFFDPSEEVQKKKYAFKCHRQTVDGVENVYPVHSLAFHPIFGTFASGGGDGIVNVWDGYNKKRIRQYPRYPTCIASLSFSPDGQQLAVASSYTWDELEKDAPTDTIFVRTVAEAEVKPKTQA